MRKIKVLRKWGNRNTLIKPIFADIRPLPASGRVEACTAHISDRMCKITAQKH